METWKTIREMDDDDEMVGTGRFELPTPRTPSEKDQAV
jgi:hypothetical protein